MKYRFISTTFSIFLALAIKAQIPVGYYNDAENLNGYPLKTALYNIIKDHSAQSYTALWSFYSANELDVYYENDGTILDMYSENPSGPDPVNFTPVTTQCDKVSVCYNREHSFPRSWFGKAAPMDSDVHHIFPTHKDVNSARANWPYGEVGTADYTSQNGCKRGVAREGLGYSGVVFEPIDEFKGDFARGHFYMATRYQNLISGWESNASNVLDGSSDKVFDQWILDMLYQWHKNDPVSQKEIDRNNAAYTYQGNRNPFVDRPEYVDSIWFPNGDTPPIDPPPSCLKLDFPKSSSNPEWYEVEFSINAKTDYSTHAYQIYRMEGDTTIADVDYSKLYFYSDSTANQGTVQYLGAIRKDTCSAVYYIPENGNEVLLYDFEKEVGEVILSNFLSEFKILQYDVIEVDSIELDGIFRKTMVVSSGDNTATWIEGIGSDKGLLWPVLPKNYYISTQHPLSNNINGRMIVCFHESDSSIYTAWEGNCYYEASSGIESKNPNDKAQIKLFPQPVSERLNIRFEGLGLKQISIYNQLGSKVYTNENPENELDINVSNFPSGIYFLMCKTVDEVPIETQMIIIN